MANGNGRLATRISAQIMDHVRSHGLKAGQHLPEQMLAETFRVSRAPVRAALQMLQELQIVRLEPNRGFFLEKDAEELHASIGVSLDAEEEEEPYLEIASDRLDGRLPERISENELMRRYELPRGQVLRVLNRIAQEGWAERLPGHGWAFLPTLASRDAYDAGYRFRVTIEPAAVLEPGFQIDEPALRLAREEQQALLAGDILRLSRTQLFHINSSFHEMLVGWSNNPFYLDALKRVNRVRRLLEYRITVDRSRLGRQCREHLQILDKLEAGETKAAAEFLRDHLAYAREIKTAALV